MSWPTFEVRFSQKYVVVPQTDCWEWQAACAGRYGQFWDGTRKRPAHVWSYENFVGPVPEGMQLDHFRFPESCIGPFCVNWSHVRPATGWENTIRGSGPSAQNLAKVKCGAGHVFDAENTYLRPNGSRGCKKCQQIREAQYREKPEAVVRRSLARATPEAKAKKHAEYLARKQQKVC